MDGTGGDREHIAVTSMAWYIPTVKYAGCIKPELVPGPRAAHSSNLIGSKLFVFGGWNGKQGLNDLHCLDVDTLEWSIPTTTGSVPSTRNNHATFVHGSKLYIHGGHDGSKWLSDLFCYDTEREEWSNPQVSGDLPSARACHTTTLLNRKVYMFGGYDGSKCFNDLDVLDLDTMTWIRPIVKGLLPQARNAQTVTVVGTKLFLFGGHSGNKHLRDLHLFDTETYTWSQPDVKGHVPPGLRGHTANLIGTKVFLFGGYDGRGRSNDLYLLDTESLKWEHPGTSEATPAGRQRHTACLVNNKKLFVLGGFDGFKWLSDLHVLDVSKLEESEITSHSVTHLLNDFRSLVNNAESFPDIEFIVEGQTLYAHKAILCARSTHFKAMFSSGFKESTAKAIEYKDWSAPAFTAMLEFLYTGSVRDLTAQTALDVMGLADHTGLDGLRQLCASSLMHAIDGTSVCELISHAHRCGAAELKQACLEYILKHHSQVDLGSLKTEPELLLEVLQIAFRNRL